MRVALPVCALSVGVPVGVCGRGFEARRQQPLPPGARLRVALGGRLPDLEGRPENQPAPGLRGPLGRQEDGGSFGLYDFWVSVLGKKRVTCAGPQVGPGASAFLILQSALGPACHRILGNGEGRLKPRATPLCSSARLHPPIETGPARFYLPRPLILSLASPEHSQDPLG